VAYAKKNPGQLRFGSPGIGTPGHLAMELFMSITKIKLLNVPYKSLPPTLTAVMNDEIDMATANVSAVMPHVQSGKVKALVVLSNERVPWFPDIPSAREAGVEDWDVSQWYAILVPAGTPNNIIVRLHEEWNKCLMMEDTKEMLMRVRFETMSGTTEQVSQFIKTETRRWAKVIEEANIAKID
jgi:tripartite-type tricarboxylate transporter receptor subunit TctC